MEFIGFYKHLEQFCCPIRGRPVGPAENPLTGERNHSAPAGVEADFRIPKYITKMTEWFFLPGEKNHSVIFVIFVEILKSASTPAGAEWFFSPCSGFIIPVQLAGP